MNNVTQSNFASGELSPRVWSRFTLPLYTNGLELARNFIVELQGAARFRTGTRFVNHTRLHRVPFLIPFQFNDEQSYILEFTEGFMRVFKDEGVIVEPPKTISGATQADPVVISATAHGYANGDEIFINEVVGMTKLNGKSYLVANQVANTFEITDIDGVDIDGTGFTAYSSAGVAEKIFEITTPYEEEDHEKIKFAQNADTMYQASQEHDIQKLTRTDHDAWTLSTFSRTSDPFPSQAITAATQANPVVITSTAHGFVDGDIVSIHEVVGMIELNHNQYKVANKTANSFELNTLQNGAVDGTGFTAYISGGVVGDPPSSVAFFEGRIFYGGSSTRPETFWGSRSPTNMGVTRYDDFTTGTDADHATIFTLSPSAQGTVDHIEWLAGNVEFLLCGTFGGITKITGDGVNEPITPTSINSKPVTGEGVADASPIPQGSILLYIQRGGLVIRSFEFDALADNFVAVDRNLAADHITQSGIKQLAFQNGIPDALWAVRNDGVLLGNSFKAKEDVSGWHQHFLGGTDVKVLSVAVISKPNSFDQIWVGVERTMNSVTRRTIEFFEGEPVIPRIEDFYTGDANELEDRASFVRAMNEIQKEYIHLDSMLTYDGSEFGTNAGATLTPDAIMGTGIEFTASAAVFTPDMVGRQLWKKAIGGVGVGRAEITAFTDTTHVDCTILKDFDNTVLMAAGDWYLTTDSISGADHLEAELATVVTDGGKHPLTTVSLGIAPLDYQSSVVHIGLGYTGLIKTLNLEGGGLTGSAQTKPTSVSKTIVRFLDSLGARVGSHRYKLEDIPFRSTDDLTSTPVPLFTGTKNVSFEDGAENKKHVYVEQANPQPCVVQAIDVYMEVSDE